MGRQSHPLSADRSLSRQGSDDDRASIVPWISPDGTRVALDVIEREGRDVWIWDLRRSTLECFTRDPAGHPLVAWSRDGSYLAFGSERSGVSNRLGQAADGSGEPERLLESDTLQMPISFAPDGRLLFSASVAGQQRDIHVVSLDGTRRAAHLHLTMLEKVGPPPATGDRRARRRCTTPASSPRIVRPRSCRIPARPAIQGLIAVTPSGQPPGGQRPRVEERVLAQHALAAFVDRDETHDHRARRQGPAVHDGLRVGRAGGRRAGRTA
jgi:hypothetical protein